MATITDRYSTAVHSRNLSVDEKTRMSDTDVLSAMAWADRTLTDGRDRQGNHHVEAPLAVPLQRLFSGDNRAAHDIVLILADMAWRQARGMKVKMGRIQAHDLACQCLAWHRNGTCTNCGGHGYDKIPGTTTLSSHECGVCRGTGKIPFEDAIDPKGTNIGLRELGRWLLNQMERDMGRAAPLAMAALAERMEL